MLNGKNASSLRFAGVLSLLLEFGCARHIFLNITVDRGGGRHDEFVYSDSFGLTNEGGRYGKIAVFVRLNRSCLNLKFLFVCAFNEITT